MGSDSVLQSPPDHQLSLNLMVGGHRYLARSPKPAPSAVRDVGGLFTVIHVPSAAELTSSYLRAKIVAYLQCDDVFHPECLHGLLLSTASKQEDASMSGLSDVLAEWGTRWVRYSTPVLAPGPYYLTQQGIYELFRIYDDKNRAFLVSSVPSQNTPSTFEDGGVCGTFYGCLGIPVPSRLYRTPTSNYSLGGLRIAVKDVFHLKGLRTSVCNRAYFDLYPPQENTAVCVQRLCDAGAYIVGKAHCSSFAWREEPTECIDYPAPINPRADGMQSPAGSSSGSGAAIASYDWLDFTLGTDTTGSGRRPALWNGSFALRPSAGVLSCDGMVPTCPKFDVPSFFGRDISTFSTLIRACYERPLAPETDTSKPWSIIYPLDFLPVQNSEQMVHIDRFTKELADFLKAGVHKIDIAALWDDTGPVAEPLDRYFRSVQEHGFFFDAYHCFNDFRQDYEQKHHAPPYVSPPTKWLWGIAELIDEEQHEEAVRRFSVFRQWFLKNVLRVGKQNTLVILPIENLETRYRDRPPPVSSVPPKGINVLYVSPILGSPELVVPVGHIGFHSEITERAEQMPVSVSVLAEPDMDLRLVELVEKFLFTTGKPTKVQTGRTMFPI